MRERFGPGPLVLLALLSILAGCDDGTGLDYYVGRLDDFSYAGQRYRAVGPNGHGKDVELVDFEGKFVWVDYSASWCGPCNTQARVIRRLERQLGEQIVFLTIMIDSGEPRTDPTPQTALDWANRFGLDAAHVVAQRRYVGMIPHHLLFSPKGQVLYRGAGLHSAELLQARLSEHMSDWNRWNSVQRAGTGSGH